MEVSHILYEKISCAEIGQLKPIHKNIYLVFHMEVSHILNEKISCAEIGQLKPIGEEGSEEIRKMIFHTSY